MLQDYLPHAKALGNNREKIEHNWSRPNSHSLIACGGLTQMCVVVIVSVRTEWGPAPSRVFKEPSRGIILGGAGGALAPPPPPNFLPIVTLTVTISGVHVDVNIIW